MQQPQPFTHIPRAADVPSEPEYQAQRYFTGLAGEDLNLRFEQKPCEKHQAGYGVHAEAGVMRHAAHDHATVRFSLSHGHGESTTHVYATPAELRDLAQRLLDAAHDIEAHPAAVLACAQPATATATASEEVAA